MLLEAREGIDIEGVCTGYRVIDDCRDNPKPFVD